MRMQSPWQSNGLDVLEMAVVINGVGWKSCCGGLQGSTVHLGTKSGTGERIET
jgi:hypothetical protein